MANLAPEFVAQGELQASEPCRSCGAAIREFWPPQPLVARLQVLVPSKTPDKHLVHPIRVCESCDSADPLATVADMVTEVLAMGRSVNEVIAAMEQWAAEHPE